MRKLIEEKEKIIKELENINYNIYKELNSGKDYSEVYNGKLFKQRKLLSIELDIIEQKLSQNKRTIISDEFIELRKNDDNIIGEYYIYLNDVNDSIGTITYKGYHNQGSNDIGYIIDEKYRKRGYASRALDLLSEHLFNNNINDFWISCYKTNIPSIKIITNYGATLVKEERDILLFECYTKKRKNKNK